MSAAPAPAAATPAPARGRALRVTQGRVLRPESARFGSLRSTRWTLRAAVVLMTGLGALVPGVTASQDHTLTAADKATFHPVTTSLTGVIVAAAAVGVPGAPGVPGTGGAYGTGMIGSSLTAVPRRLPVLRGKPAVLAGGIVPVWPAASLVCVVLGQALLSGRHLGGPVTAPDALRSVTGAALDLTVAGLTGVALGALLRHTPGGITTFAAVFVVIPQLAPLLPASISGHLAPCLPPNAGGVLWGGAAHLPNALSPWTGFALLGGYTAILIGAGAWRLRRSDA